MFEKIEKWLFVLLVCTHLIPLIALDFFVTHDGPSHTYNTVLIEDLLSGENVPAQAFFEFTSDPQPNWGYNALMLVTNKIFSAVASEKIIIGAIILLMAFSFRELIRLINPANVFQSYLILPFLFSFHLYLGFYNFCIGAAIFFFLLCYMVKKNDNPSTSYYIILCLVSLLMLFSHAFSFMLFCLCVSGYVITRHYFVEKKLFQVKLFRHLLFYFLALIPSLLFCVYFLFSKYEGAGKHWLDLTVLLKYIYECAPAITLTYDQEKIYGIATAVFVMINSLLVIYFRIKSNQKNIIQHDIWMLLAIITLVIYFIMPDAVGVWGFISLRTLMFFFLFLPIWFAHADFPRWWKYVQILVFTILISFRLNYQFGLSKQLSDDAKEMFSLTEKIKLGSIILPLDYYNNWMHDNISNYIGTVNHNLVLDNYEAVFPHFPLHFSKKNNPYTLLGNFSGRIPPCANMEKFETTTNVKIDYVIRWLYKEDEDSCTAKINKQLEEKFVLIYKSEKGAAELFKRKNP